MQRLGKIARIIIAALTLAGLMNWNTTEQRAATSGTLTGPGDQSCSGSACNGKIAFVSASENENGKKTHTIYKMNPDGSDRMQLTSGPADFAPAWSPDGAQIVFVRNNASSEQSEIYIMNAEGSDQRGLTSGESDHSPAWSPDGKQIVFVRLIQEGGSRHGQIFAINADGSNQRRLTNSADMDFEAVWSPDGTKIAFSRGTRFGTSLVLMNADGTDQRTIGASYTPAAWSPDNSKLAFASINPQGLFVVDADGGSLTGITNSPIDGIDANPSWSPDGSKISFLRFDGCNIELVDCRREQVWVVNADGSNPTKLVDDTSAGEALTWSSDGTRIILGQRGDLFVINADGSGMTNLTSTGDQLEFGASWQPVPTPGCVESISPTQQQFESIGGTGSIDVAAINECGWTAASNASWMSVTSAGSGNGNGRLSYAVGVNKSTAARTGAIRVASRFFVVSQSGAPVMITSVSVAGKRLFVFGENFDAGAVILVNDEAQITKNDGENPQTTVIGKKAGKRVKPGDKLKVRNPNGSTSQEFIFAG